MPGAHRDTDSRFCGAKTIVVGQSSVKVNGILWAVEGDIDTHCNQGSLSAVYGPRNVYIEKKRVICAMGDTASDDMAGCEVLHPAGSTDPLGHSSDVVVPEVVTPRQVRLLFLQQGLLDQVEYIISQQDRATQITWEFAIEFKRVDPLLNSLAQTLNLTEEQVDQFFIAASQL